MRLFVALNLPDPERQRLFDVTAALRSGRFPFRWVRPESIHLTLRFLGEVPEGQRAAAIRETLDRVAERHARFAMSIGGLGAFPSLRRPRVLWMGAEGGEALLALQAEVEQSLAELGYEPERRPWSAHLTLARAEPRARSAFDGLVDIAGAIDYSSIVEVESIDLMRSHLSRGGARYERIAMAALRGSRSNERTGEAAE